MKIYIIIKNMIITSFSVSIPDAFAEVSCSGREVS